MSIRFISFLFVISSLAGCAGLTQMQDTISRFDQGAHAVASGQIAFFRQVQAADCSNQFYTSAFNFSINKSNKLDLSGRCTPTILTADQIKIRQDLMTSLTLYVDKLQILATSDDNKALDSNSRDLAQKLNGIAKSHGFTSKLSLAAGVESAVISITEMALDHRKFKDIKEAAREMAPAIHVIVGALKTENVAFAEAMASKMDALEPQLHLALVEARDNAVKACKANCLKRGNGPAFAKCMSNCSYAGARSLLDVIAAREVLRSVNPLGSAQLSVPVGSEDKTLDPTNTAAQLNASLDALENANRALANAGTGGTVVAVNSLVARARHANDVLASIGK